LFDARCNHEENNKKVFFVTDGLVQFTSSLITTEYLE